MPTETQIQEQILTASELAGLMLHFRVSIPSSSPLARIMGEQMNLTTMQALKDRGLLDSGWEQVVRLLEAGAPALTVREASLDSIAESHIFANPGIERDPRGVLVRRTNGGDYRLRFPMGLPDLLVHLMDPLDPVGAAPPMVFDRKLSAAALTALAAAVDHLRILFAASLLERRGLEGIVLQPLDLHDQLVESVCASDNRSLALLIALLLPEARSGDLDAGIAELRSAGLLIDVNDPAGALTPHPELVDLAYNLMSPVPAVSLAPHRTDGQAGGSPAQRLVAIRGTSLWHLQAEVNDGSFRLSCVDGLSSLKDVLGFLAQGTGVSAPVRSAEPAQPVCQSCAKPLRPTAKICPWCSTPVRSAEPAQPVCQSCAKPLRPTAKICPWCSTPVRSAEPAQLVCQSCAKPLRPRAKICPWCTTPVRSVTAAPHPPSVH
jgi:hypothetical protein